MKNETPVSKNVVVYGTYYCRVHASTAHIPFETGRGEPMAKGQVKERPMSSQHTSQSTHSPPSNRALMGVPRATHTTILPDREEAIYL